MFAPPAPKPPRAPLVPFGRRLAHALRAFWKLGFPAALPALAAPPNPPPAPAPPGDAVTPFFSRHDRNAVADAVPEEEDDEDEGLEPVLVVGDDFDAVAAPPQAAASSATNTTAVPTLSRRRALEAVARRHTHRSGANS